MNIVHNIEALQCRKVLLDVSRLEALKEVELINDSSRLALDRLTRLASEVLNVPLTIVSFVGATEHHFKSFHGLPEPWASHPVIPIENSVCQYTLIGDILSLEDVRQFPLLADNPAVPALNLVAYLGIPLITPDGQNLGAFCAIDYQRRSWSQKEIAILKDLTSCVMSEIFLQLGLEKLKHAQEDREKVLAMMAHDIRSPIAAVHGYAELIGESLDDQEFCLEAVSSITRLTKKSIEIMESYLDSKIIALTQKEISPTVKLNLVEIVKNIVVDLRFIHGPSIQLESSFDNYSFALNQHSFTRALENLVGNAVKYGSKGRDITIRLVSDASFLRVEVHNWGNPITIEDQHHIFGHGKRTLEAIDSGTKGWGLGLELVQKVLSAHGGRINLESSAHAGTTFGMLFPLPAF